MKKKYHSPLGLPKNSEFPSIHAEHKAIEDYIYHNRPRKGKKISIIVWRNCEDIKFGCAKPCGLCTNRTLPRLCKILGITNDLLEIYYTSGTGIIKTTLQELINTPQYISSGSRNKFK